jgi:hypothetical protein
MFTFYFDELRLEVTFTRRTSGRCLETFIVERFLSLTLRHQSVNYFVRLHRVNEIAH